MAASIVVGAGDVLLLVDVQNDFLPGGSLGVPRGDEVIAPLNRAIGLFMARSRPVFASRDWHPVRHCSFREQGGPWPPHCVVGSPGADFAPGLALPASAVMVFKATRADEESYSVFGGTGFEGMICARPARSASSLGGWRPITACLPPRATRGCSALQSWCSSTRSARSTCRPGTAPVRWRKWRAWARCWPPWTNCTDPAQERAHHRPLPAHHAARVLRARHDAAGRLRALRAQAAAGFLTIGAVLAVAQVVVDRRLRSRKPLGILQILTPLESLESGCFHSILAGFLLLTLALVSGAFFVENLLAQHLVHKVVLAIVAWVVFGIPLYGRRRFGWRGRKALRCTLAGYVLLGLSYFGSKLVLENLLGRHWG